MSKHHTRRSTGFTIIELVVVIVIIGILAATALPRFVDMTGEAQSAQVQAIGGAFASGVNLAHASWIAQGATAAIDSAPLEGGLTVGLSDEGWPENTNARGGNGTTNANECIQLWNAILTQPPTIARGTREEWQAQASGSVCTYTYNVAEGRNFTYDVTTGQVVTTVP